MGKICFLELVGKGLQKNGDPSDNYYLWILIFNTAGKVSEIRELPGYWSRQGCVHKQLMSAPGEYFSIDMSIKYNSMVHLCLHGVSLELFIERGKKMMLYQCEQLDLGPTTKRLYCIGEKDLWFYAAYHFDSCLEKGRAIQVVIAAQFFAFSLCTSALASCLTSFILSPTASLAAPSLVEAEVCSLVTAALLASFEAVAPPPWTASET